MLRIVHAVTCSPVRSATSSGSISEGGGGGGGGGALRANACQLTAAAGVLHRDCALRKAVGPPARLVRRGREGRRGRGRRRRRRGLRSQRENLS